MRAERGDGRSQRVKTIRASSTIPKRIEYTPRFLVFIVVSPERRSILARAGRGLSFPPPWLSDFVDGPRRVEPPRCAHCRSLSSRRPFTRLLERSIAQRVCKHARIA